MVDSYDGRKKVFRCFFREYYLRLPLSFLWGGSSQKARPIHKDLVRRKKMNGRITGKGERAMKMGIAGTPGVRAAHTATGITTAVTISSLTTRLMAIAPV